nr:hypothetical protein [Tanacetum cinerariifolium]
ISIRDYGYKNPNSSNVCNRTEGFFIINPVGLSEALRYKTGFKVIPQFSFRCYVNYRGVTDWHQEPRVMYTFTHPITIPSDSDIEDAFSSTHSLDNIPALPDYFPASPGNTSSDPSDDLSKYLLASLAISLFYDDPISALEMIIEDIQVRHRSDKKSLLDKIRELKNHKGGPPGY